MSEQQPPAAERFSTEVPPDLLPAKLASLATAAAINFLLQTRVQTSNLWSAGVVNKQE